MDLISREAVKKHIWDLLIPKDVDDMPSAFEGMTNGEVIKAVFPNLKYNRGDGFTMIEADNHATRILIWDSFWDSPYKGVSE